MCPEILHGLERTWGDGSEFGQCGEILDGEYETFMSMFNGKEESQEAK